LKSLKTSEMKTMIAMIFGGHFLCVDLFLH